MRARDQHMQRLGEGERDPTSLAARAGAFLAEAQPTMGLSDGEIGAIERRLGRKRHRGVPWLWPALAATAVLLVAGSVMAVVGLWHPRWPFSGDERPGTSPAVAPERHHAVGPKRPSRTEAAQPAAGVPDEGVPVVAPTAEIRPAVRRAPHAEPPAAAPSPAPPEESPLSAEARSLSDALARWRRDGDAEAALASLGAHERRFPRSVFSVEAKVARAEILLALGRRGQALGVLDGLTLTRLPRARELFTIRGELRAEAGRCSDARADLSSVLGPTAGDDLGRRATAAIARCP